MGSTYFRINADEVQCAQISEILPGLYISGVMALTPEILKKHGITLIINTTDEVPSPKSLGDMRKIKLGFHDNPDQRIAGNLQAICEQIYMEIKCGGRVLVHSVRGVSRSATVGLAYLMIVRELTLKQAYIYLAAKRSKVEPNYGFWRDLITVEQEYWGTIGTVKLIRDPTDPNKIVPDVYYKVAEAAQRKLREIANQESSNSNEIIKSRLHGKDPNKDELSKENQGTGDSNESLDTKKAEMDARALRIAKLAAVCNISVSATHKWRRMSKKFKPSLETLHELVETAA